MEVTDNLDKVKVHLGRKVDCNEYRKECNLRKYRQHLYVRQFFKKFS